MASNITTILSLANNIPLSLLTAHPWYSDFPTNSDATFSGCGFFSGGDLPFGMVVELHNVAAGTPSLGHEISTYPKSYAHIANNAHLSGGYSSTLPCEEFYLARPRQLIRFFEPSTTSISVDMVAGVFLEIWGLYVDIPLITPTQMSWNSTLPAGIDLDVYVTGATYSGITDFGTLALSPGTIGVQVNVTVIPAESGSYAGNPLHRYQLGWINWGDGFGFRDREWITSSAFQSFPRAPQYAPAIGYSLTPGTEISVTELIERRTDLLGTLG